MNYLVIVIEIDESFCIHLIEVAVWEGGGGAGRVTVSLKVVQNA